MNVDLCRRCRKSLGNMDIILCKKCLEEWTTWYKVNVFKFDKEKLREIRMKWVEGEELP